MKKKDNNEEGITEEENAEEGGIKKDNDEEGNTKEENVEEGGIKKKDNDEEGKGGKYQEEISDGGEMAEAAKAVQNWENNADEQKGVGFKKE